MRTRIKICGLTQEQDVEDVIDAGVDALGFVFYDQSPRFVSPKRVRQMIDLCPPWVHKVGLFVNATEEEVLRASEISGINQIQLHGNESFEHCHNIGLPVIKAVRVGKKCNLENNNEKQTSQLLESKRYLDFCDAVLLDSFTEGFGGSGKSFDWSILKDANSIFGRRWVLSGGLNSQNVYYQNHQSNIYF